jgi:LacI family transcriptional regulator
MLVGMIVRDVSNPFTAEIILGADRALRTAGYALAITNSERDPDLDSAHVRQLRQRAVDGLLVSLSDEGHQPTLDELRRLTTPFVAIDRELPEDLAGSSVVCDRASGVESAARYLASLGHRRIGLLAGSTAIRPGREDARGLTEFCASRP